VGLAAYEWNLGDAANDKQDQLERFTANCLKYVAAPVEQKVAMLVPGDYQTGSADERDAVAWFQKTYVAQGKGVILTPATIDDLDIETNPVCWVMADRIGIERGWQNLPADLVNSETIAALKAYAADGGNLFLTNHATQLTVALGRLDETFAPVIWGSGEGQGLRGEGQCHCAGHVESCDRLLLRRYRGFRSHQHVCRSHSGRGSRCLRVEPGRCCQRQAGSAGAFHPELHHVS